MQVIVVHGGDFTNRPQSRWQGRSIRDRGSLAAAGSDVDLLVDLKPGHTLLDVAAFRREAGLRDLIAHEYFRIDIHRVLQIVERDLPSLEQAIDSLFGNARSD